MIDSEIDTLYAPSKWSKRDQVSQQHIDFATEGNIYVLVILHNYVIDNFV